MRLSGLQHGPRDQRVTLFAFKFRFIVFRDEQRVFS